MINVHYIDENIVKVYEVVQLQSICDFLSTVQSTAQSSSCHNNIILFMWCDPSITSSATFIAIAHHHSIYYQQSYWLKYGVEPNVGFCGVITMYYSDTGTQIRYIISFWKTLLRRVVERGNLCWVNVLSCIRARLWHYGKYWRVQEILPLLYCT